MPNWLPQHRYNQIPGVGFVMPTSSTEPAAPVAFELWAHPGTGKASWRTPGGTWIALDDVADGAVTNAKIAARAGIALSKLATNPLDRAQHTGTQLAATISDFVTQVRANRLDQIATAGADLNAGGFRWTNLGAPQGPNVLLDKRAGLDLHQLRHSAATHLGDAEIPLQLIMGKTRHKNPRTAMRYVKPGAEAIATATDVLAPRRRTH
ncbi:tyrosine-type recombinase/integrase [Nonomuraea sp. NPDC005692]|uniref:tyrosine-type recombinase/integrase n=1 Tax=Nonomuraea sp. NPDC005692 TaxID=3157168 RepID=UPI0033E92E53